MNQAARHLQTPNANSPQLLTRLLEMVARGVRSTRGLQESLGVEARTVQYYTQAGQWLGLLEPDDTAALTPLGLDYVYAGPRRPVVYAEAVWAQPMAASLLSGRDAQPTVEDVMAAVSAAEPELAPATLRRRASAVRSLIAPAVGRQPGRPAGAAAHQLALPLSMAPTQAPPPKLPLAAGKDWNPDVYRYVLGALLDFGELTLGHVRALLDRAGADALPLGGYVDMAIARGDAHRRNDRLTVTDDAIDRRELVESTNSIILSDPAYRRYLADAVEAETSREAEIRRDQLAARFKPWDRRVFGHPLRPEQVRVDLERVLMDRSLDAFPVARPSAPERVAVVDNFLDAWESERLTIACPPYLAQIQGGLAGVNAILRKARQGQNEVGLPTLAYRPVLAHGGLMHPGEPLPRSVPDLRSLRLRTLLCSPYPALITAILLLHRQRSDRFEVVRGTDGWEVRWGRKRLGPLLGLCDRFGRSRGWAVSRRPGGIDGGTLVRSLEVLGIAWITGKRAVLEERFFGQLRRSPEEFEVFEQLQPLAMAIDDWLETEGSK